MEPNILTHDYSALHFKSAITKVEDVDPKGTVKFWFAVHEKPDNYLHIGHKGMFQKSINERFPQIMHRKNHNSDSMPGVITELQDTEYGGMATSKLILGTKDGLETHEQYKAMAEAGKSMPHSYHFDFINPSEQDAVKAFINKKSLDLREVKLKEVSTLTKDACMPDATMISVKSFEDIDFADLLVEERYYKALLNCKFSDFDLTKMEEIKNHISALIISRKSTDKSNEPHTYNSFQTLITSKN